MPCSRQNKRKGAIKNGIQKRSGGANPPKISNGNNPHNLPDSGNYFAANNSGQTFLRMFHMEQFAKNQKSAKKENCGFFIFPENLKKSRRFAFFEIFGAGAPVRSQRSIHIFAGNL